MASATARGGKSRPVTSATRTPKFAHPFAKPEANAARLRSSARRLAIAIWASCFTAGSTLGPIVGGQLGSLSWRAPFFGVAVLMVVAVVVTSVLLPATPPSGTKTSLAAPLKALRHPGLLTVALTALFYNMCFFTLLAFTPFPLDMSASQVGWVFFGWGLLLAITSVKTAPWLQRRFGTIP